MYSVQTVPPVHLLQTLVVFAEQENLVQTAERLELTQPTVSRQLQQLEELFSRPLFTLQGRNKVLTDYGQALVNELKPRFADLERVFEKIDQTFSNPKEIKLRLGGNPVLLERYLSKTSFIGTIEISALTNEQAEIRLKGQELDLSITSTELISSDLISKKLLASVPALAIPKKWATDVETAKDWTQICSNHSVCSFSKEKILLSDFEKKYKLQLQTNYIVEDWAALERRIHAQKSWGVIPSNYLHENHGYKIIPLAGMFASESYFLSYRKELAKFPWMKNFIAEMTT